ncbi:hypothetical protein B0H11DRAFT_1907882 [Mycena galericulata]|nr:hypothetical protein B0H11DRAFT_1907882 [Mycena galericulata]
MYFGGEVFRPDQEAYTNSMKGERMASTNQEYATVHRHVVVNQLPLILAKVTPVPSCWIRLGAVQDRIDKSGPGRNARFIIISGTPGCLREGKFSAECEAGLAALNDIDDADEAGGLTGSFASKILDLCCDGVEIALPSFRDLLADKPVDSANAIQSLSEWSAGVAVDGEKVKKGGKTAGKTA